MDFLKSIAIAASGLRAQAGRMRIISENIANADSTAPTPGAEPYRRKIATFKSEIDRALDAQVVGARPRQDRSVRIPHQARARPSGRRRQRQCQISQRQFAGRNDGPARGAALLRGQHQRHRRLAPHDPAHHRNSQILIRRDDDGHPEHCRQRLCESRPPDRSGGPGQGRRRGLRRARASARWSRRRSARSARPRTIRHADARPWPPARPTSSTWSRRSPNPKSRSIRSSRCATR